MNPRTRGWLIPILRVSNIFAGNTRNAVKIIGGHLIGRGILKLMQSFAMKSWKCLCRIL